MKAKKALKRLRRVEELLSLVIDEFAGNEPGVRELLDSAKRSVIRAKAGINFQATPANVKKLPSKTKQTRHSGLTAEGRKRSSPARKERSIGAKRTSERKIGTPVKPVGEGDSAKSGSLPTPMMKPVGRPLHSAGSLEADPHQHAD